MMRATGPRAAYHALACSSLIILTVLTLVGILIGGTIISNYTNSP